MEGHDVVTLPQEVPEISGTCAESGWGTCEELLLVSAVKRHGANNWNLISEEVKARAISLNASPLYFSEAACKQKYDILKGRYASFSSSSRSRSEDLVNDIYWFEELRKLRVAHLKRELEHYDGSIGNLQVKIKRLKAGKAPDTSVSTQLRMSIANSQSNEEVAECSRCEISVQTAIDIRLEADYNQLRNTPVTLESIRNSWEITSSQTPSNLQEQVLSESEQLHDAIEDLPVASLTYTDVKTTVNVINNTPFSKSVNGGNDVEQDRGGNSSVLSLAETQFYGTPSVPGSPADDLQDVEADEFCTSNKDEQLELPMSWSGHQLVDDLADSLVKNEAGDVVAQALDKDEVQVGILDLQIGRELTVKMDVKGLGIIHGDYGQKGMDGAFVTSADSIFNMNASKKRGFDGAKAESHAREDVVVSPILSSNQRRVSSGNVGNAEYGHAEPNTVTEERVNLSKNESGMGALEKKLFEEADCHPILEVGLNNQVHVALPFDLAKAELGELLGTTVSEYPDDVTRTIPSPDEVLNATRKISRLSEGCHHFNKDVISTIRDEVISSGQKKLLLEGSSVKGDDSTVHAVKELPILGAENGGFDRNSDGMAMKRASRPKESDKIRFFGVIPVASFSNSESIVPRDGAIEKSDPRGSGRRSGFFNTSDMSQGSLHPERRIVISLDGPGKTTPSSENTSIMPANAEDSFSQLNTPTRPDVICDTEAIAIIEEQHISAQLSRNVDSCERKEWETPHGLPGAMDLLLEVYETGQESASESVFQTVQAVQCVAGASVTPVSSTSISKSKSVEQTPTLAVRMDHDGKMTEETTTDSDEQPRTSAWISRRDLDILGQDFRGSRARYSMGLAENIGSVSDQDTLLNSTEEIQVELGERSDTSEKNDLPVCLGRISELARYASCVAEEIIVDMKLEFGREELSGVDSEAELCSPVESLVGGLCSKMPTCHEGSDNVQDQYKDGCSDRNRERTQGSRDHVESDVDKSEARSPLDLPYEISPSSRRNHKESRVPGKPFSLLEVFRNLSNHKSAFFFKGRQEDPRYSLLIRRHLDLNFVRTRLDEGAYSSSSEFFRDLLLIFNNGMVYYTRGSVEFRGAKALFTEATKEMNRIFQTEALLKQDRPATRTREVKKPKAFAGVASPGKGLIPSIGATSSAKLADTISPLISLPDSGNKKRANSRLGLAETPTNSHSEGGAPRSASANILGDPSSSRAEEAEYSQENDQEVNGRLKDRKKPQKVSGSSRGKPHREELLEGILLRNAANKSLGRPKLRDLKDGALARIPAVLTKGVEGENVADSESANMSEAEKEKMRGKEVRGKERDEIDDDDDDDGGGGGDDFLCKGKSLCKLIDLDDAPERGPEGTPFPKSRPTAADRVASNCHGIVSQVVGRSSRGRRKVCTPAKEPQAKKRMRR